MIIVSLVLDPSMLGSFEIESIASYTSFSERGSKADVASSKIRSLGFFTKARAIAILYFYPPERFKTAEDPT